jgi:hypothetical protein
MEMFGTDIGPRCSKCGSTIYVYRFFRESCEASATCAACHAKTSFSTPYFTVGPTVAALRARHESAR